MSKSGHDSLKGHRSGRIGLVGNEVRDVVGHQDEQGAGTLAATDEITVLFTDIEGSTQRWERRPQEMSRALQSHDEVLRTVTSEYGGWVHSHMGDGMALCFRDPTDAVNAAIAMQQSLQNLSWPGGQRLPVRMGIHTGEGLLVEGEYRGPTLNKTARVSDLANGDQIVVSERTAELAEDVRLRDVGDHMLKGIGYERLLVVDDSRLLANDRPLRSSMPAPRTPLPIWLTPLVGRSIQQQRIAKMLDGHRLVTVKGPGGVGKTRIAVEVARSAADQFADGVAFCDLAPVVDEAGVTAALASAIGARQQPGMTLGESIASYLSDRTMLVVLDNCEHVVRAVQALAGPIFRQGGSRILATSREVLRISGEQVLEIGPLDASSDAVELFRQRSSERDGSFQPSAEDLRTIEDICRLLDGMPLAIELASARLRVMSIAELYARMDDRFSVLGSRKDDSRHGGIRQTIEWSHEQLDEDEAALFRRLSVFAGSFELRAVEAICGDDLLDRADILDATTSLVDKSMLTRVPGSGQVRFRLLETLREFGAEKLAAAGEDDVLRQRHSDYYAQLTTQMSESLLSDDEANAWEQIDLDWDNIRRAFAKLLDCGATDAAIGLTLDLAWFATFSMRFEALAFAEQLLTSDHDVAAHPMYGELIGLRALLAYFTADPKAAEHAAEALRIDPVDVHGISRGALSAVYLNNQFSKAESDALTSEWVELAYEQSPLSQVWAFGMRAFHLGTYVGGPEAQSAADNVRWIADESESPSASALASWAEGMAAIRDDIVRADNHWLEGLEVASSLGPNHLLTHLINGLRLHVMVEVADPTEAAAACIPVVEHAVQQHYLAGTSHLFGVVGVCLARSGRAEAAAKLLETMMAHGHQPRSNARHALVRALGYDPKSFAFDASSSMSINEAAVFALDQLSEVVASPTQ